MHGFSYLYFVDRHNVHNAEPTKIGHNIQNNELIDTKLSKSEGHGNVFKN